MKICHLSSVHPRNDIRIFLKECISLKDAGYDVSYVVADGLRDDNVNAINIYDVGKVKHRLTRMFVSSLKVVFKGLSLKADLYHFHDPELAPFCLVYLLLGKKVIFDVHENVAEQIQDKPWLGNFQKKLLSRLFHTLNKFFARTFYTIIYDKMNLKLPLTTVLNYPKLNFFKSYQSNIRNGNEFFYIGGVSNNRGLDTILEAFDFLDKQKIDFKMHFIGAISDSTNLEKFPNLSKKVIFYGRKNLEDGYEISRRCVAGLAILKPIGNYVKSYPTKVFEYMAVGLPVVTSNFSLYKQIVEDNEVGWCVDPNSPREIAQLLNEIINDNSLETISKRAMEHSVNYSWKNEEEKLLMLYRTILE
jgi:glycosyltransferase involved in cell wall biosynthesis